MLLFAMLRNRVRSFVARLFAILIALILGAFSHPAMAQEQCVMDDSDRQWLSGALEQWHVSARDDLGIAEVAMPTVYAIDAKCLYQFPMGDLLQPIAANHGGKPRLPDGSSLLVAPVSFAFGRDQFAMSLPSVWRAAGVKSEYGLEHLMTGVLLHEIMHTLQSDLATRLLDPIGEEHGIGDELSDDFLQERFADAPGYEPAYREEVDVLFAAVAAESDAVARGLAAHGLHLMRARRDTWLAGNNAYYEELDDIFLTMEGMGQWLIYRYFLSLDESENNTRALEATRRGGRWWSQDEGLAMMLVVDRFYPDWRELVFTDPDWRAENLLTAALAQ